MIDPTLARETTTGIATLLAILVEDEQDAMLRGFGAGDDIALAADLVTLGEDFTILARALLAIQRRIEVRHES